MDVEKAFLQSGNIDRKLFVRPPSESGTDPTKVWKLNVAAYGLTDAARRWYLKLKQTLLECGFLMCQVEPAVFFMKDSKGKLRGIIVTHVDDFLFGGDQQFIMAIEELKKKIKIGKCLQENFKFCGLELMTLKDGSLKVKLEEAKANEVTKLPTEGITERRMTAAEETQVRGKIGQLQWYASVSRRDLSFMLGELLSVVNIRRQIRCVNTIIGRFNKHSENFVLLKPMRGQIAVEVFGDSSFKDNNQQGIVVALRQAGTKICNLVR